MEKGQLIGKGRTAEVFAWGNDRVLKLYFEKFPAGRAEYEAMAQLAAYNAKLPVPAVDKVVHIDSRHGIIMERIIGPTMMELIEKQPWRIPELARLLAELHARLHSNTLPQLEASRLNLWGRIARVKVIPLPAKQALMKSLVDLPDGDAICHKDFHPNNIIMSLRGPVIIDWESAVKGNPLLDVARTWLLLTQSDGEFPFPYNVVITPLRTLFFTLYLRHYRRLCPFDRKQFLIWRPIIIAARLAEDIPAEQRRLLALLKLPQAEGEMSNVA